MAITLVASPTTGAPITASDYSLQNALIAANEVPDLSFLTDWELVAAQPLLKKGVYIYHAGNTYVVDTADEAISGTPAAGTNYIEITLSGSTLTAAFVTSTTGYTYNPAYGGIYNGTGKQLLPDICYLDGSDYIRGRCFGMDYNFIHLASGDFLLTQFNTRGGNLTTGGGDIDTGGGDLDLGAGYIGSDAFDIGKAPSTGTWSVSFPTSFIIPKGVYSFLSISGSNIRVLFYDGTAWRQSDGVSPITLISDGVNYAISNSSGTSSVRYRRL